MERRQVGTDKEYMGDYEFKPRHLVQITDILREAFGTCVIEIGDYTLSDISEISQLTQDDATSFQAYGPDYMNVGFSEGGGCVHVYIKKHMLYLSLNNKFDLKSLGAMERIGNVFQSAKTKDKPEGEGVEAGRTTRCIILLSPIENEPASNHSTILVQPAPVVIQASSISLDASKLTFWQRHKHEFVKAIYVAIISGVVGVIGALVIQRLNRPQPQAPAFIAQPSTGQTAPPTSQP